MIINAVCNEKYSINYIPPSLITIGLLEEIKKNNHRIFENSFDFIRNDLLLRFDLCPFFIKNANYIGEVLPHLINDTVWCDVSKTHVPKFPVAATEEFYMALMQQSCFNFSRINDKYKTYNLCLYVMQQKPWLYRYVPKEHRDKYELLILYIKYCINTKAEVDEITRELLIDIKNGKYDTVQLTQDQINSLCNPSCVAPHIPSRIITQL